MSKSEIKSVSDASVNAKLPRLIGNFRLCLVFHFPNSPGGQGSTKGLQDSRNSLYAGRSVVLELNDRRSERQHPVLPDREDLNQLVIPACNYQILSVFCNHEVAWMAGSAHISDFLDCTVLSCLEYRNSIVVKPM